MSKYDRNLQVFNLARGVVEELEVFLEVKSSLCKLEELYWTFYNHNKYEQGGFVDSELWDGLYELMYRSGDGSLSNKDKGWGLLGEEDLRVNLEPMIPKLKNSIEHGVLDKRS